MLSSLRKNEAFRTVYRKGVPHAKGSVVAYILKKETEEIRLGISISKKCGNAVVRHRFQRIVREVLRTHLDQFIYGADIVICARKGTRFANCREITYREMEQTLLALFRRAHLTEAART